MSTNRLSISTVISGEKGRLRLAGIEPEPKLLESIAVYSDLLLRWNRKISLTTITDPKEILERNFVESFFGARWLTAPAGLLCDIGSGAGFPGLAIKLVRPGWRVKLFEPNLKKAAFLAEVARELKLRDVEVVRHRWEETNLEPHSVDAVSARAVGGYGEIAETSRRVLKLDGRLLLWLGASEAEKLGISPEWNCQVESLPGSRERVLFIGTPRP